MVMDKYYQQDHRQELWDKINSLHLSYLEMEESPQKLEHRNKLDDCINDYLCQVAHNQKFEFPYTSEVLYKSASSNKDFSGYRAALGWDAIGRYAANLITKPWRREFRQIKMYSGFYKHEIESNLVGAEMMFEAMGYRKLGREILVLEGPVCPDRVASVSLDSLMAHAECQILKAIWEEVTPVFKVSWLDLLKYRESHVCSPKQLASSLIYMYQERQYQEKALNYQHLDPVSCNPKMQMHHMAHPQMYAPMPPQIQHIPAPCMYPMNGCCGSYMPYPQHQYPYMPVNCVPAKPQYVNAQYKYNAVPTAQLIELDHTYDVPDAPVTSHRRYDAVSANSLKTEEMEKKMRQMCVNDRKLSSEPKNSDRDDGSGTFESWDYVYRNLESQGYSKDLGERGDILSHPLDIDEVKSKTAKPVANSLNKPTNTLNKPLNNAAKLNNTITKPTNTLSKPVATPNKPPKNEIIRERKKSSELHNVVYDNLPDIPKPVAKPAPVPKVEKQPPPTNTLNKVEKLKRQEPLKAGDRPPSDWHCATCTFLNASSKDVCEMCSRSKNAKVEEIEVGGSQCNKCTFVNSREVKVCVVCGASLNNTPIYI